LELPPFGRAIFSFNFDKLLRFLREELPSSLCWVTCGWPSGRHARKRRIECADQDRSSQRPVGTISVADPTTRMTSERLADIAPWLQASANEAGAAAASSPLVSPH